MNEKIKRIEDKLEKLSAEIKELKERKLYDYIFKIYHENYSEILEFINNYKKEGYECTDKFDYIEIKLSSNFS